MAELIYAQDNGKLAFGDYTLATKAKADGFEFGGDLYKVKTFKDITKLERNGMFVYESVPGTKVTNFLANDKEVSFSAEGTTDTQVTLELEAEKEFKLFIEGTNIGKMKTNLGGKLVLSVQLTEGKSSAVRVVKQ
ncbi:MAG: endosialidase [Lachnospiraceae bacterium]|nr:endosialidase [Lachnospiraceae bacterium]